MCHSTFKNVQMTNEITIFLQTASSVRSAPQQPNQAAQTAQAAAALRNQARPITGQQATTNIQARPIAPQVAATQARNPNYKYTQNMRNPPTQPVAMAAQPTVQQAVHVKGKLICILENIFPI
jgi:polyadenylate-binding protein